QMDHRSNSSIENGRRPEKSPTRIRTYHLAGGIDSKCPGYSLAAQVYHAAGCRPEIGAPGTACVIVVYLSHDLTGVIDVVPSTLVYVQRLQMHAKIAHAMTHIPLESMKA